MARLEIKLTDRLTNKSRHFDNLLIGEVYQINLNDPLNLWIKIDQYSCMKLGTFKIEPTVIYNVYPVTKAELVVQI